MACEDSRNFPTAQELSVGKFRLAEISDVSDKTDMPTVDQVRHTILQALTKAGTGPVAVAIEIGEERNYLCDFLNGRKNSLKTEVIIKLTERYGIDFQDLLIGRKKHKAG